MIREALAQARMALEMIADASTEPTVKALAARALSVLAQAIPQAKSGAERTREWRARKRDDGDAVDVTVTDVTSRDVGGEGGGVSPDLKISDIKIPPVTTVTEVTSQASLLPDPPPPSRPGKKGTRCPSSVDPSALDFCRAHSIPEPTPGSEAAKFLDYWTARTGKDGLKLDWAATWRARPDWTKPAGRPQVQPPSPNGVRLWRTGEKV